MNNEQIQVLVAQFEQRGLPKEAWTHEAHLITAIWYLHNYSKEEAICYIRSGIISYNIAVGTANTPTSGYHETITLFWIALIHEFIQDYPNASLDELVRAFLQSKFSSKSILLDFYSSDLLFSSKARAFWIAPDLKPWPYL